MYATKRIFVTNGAFFIIKEARSIEKCKKVQMVMRKRQDATGNYVIANKMHVAISCYDRYYFYYYHDYYYYYYFGPSFI